MKSPLCPQFEAGGFRLVNCLRAWYLYESRTGLQVGESLGDQRNLLTLVWALLQTEHPDLTEANIAVLDPGPLLAAAGLALASAIPAEPLSAAGQHRGPTDWYHLWAFGRYDLRLSEEEFWRLHPLQLHALIKRMDAQIEREFYGHCITAAMIRNCNIDPEKTEPIAPVLLLPTPTGEKARAEYTAEQGAGLLDKIRALKDFFPGAKVNI